jgi:hypothetical protein
MIYLKSIELRREFGVRRHQRKNVGHGRRGQGLRSCRATARMELGLPREEDRSRKINMASLARDSSKARGGKTLVSVAKKCPLSLPACLAGRVLNQAEGEFCGG